MSIVAAGRTYIIRQEGEWQTIECLVCNRTSYNPNDVRWKYCDCCKQYHDYLARVHVFAPPDTGEQSNHDR